MILFGLGTLEALNKKQQSHLWSHIFNSGMIWLLTCSVTAVCFIEAGLCSVNV